MEANSLNLTFLFSLPPSRRQLVSPDVQVDRRRPDGARQRRDHHARRQQDGPLGQAPGVDGGGRAESEGAQRDVHRDECEGGLQCETGWFLVLKQTGSQ